MRKVIVWGLLCTPGLAFAQTQPADTVLNEVIISATRTPQEVFSLGRSATIISSDEISKSTYNTVAELLASVSSTYVVGSGQNPGANQSIFMRGSNSNHVNVLIDGVKITDPSSPNSAIDFSEISLANVERIEIVKGSHGALYGTGGIGGVINIITKKGKDGLQGELTMQLGKLGGGGLTTNQSAAINYGKNGYYINGALFNTNIKGLDATTDTVTTNSFRSQDKDNFSKTDFSTKVGYQKGDFDIYGSYKKVKQEADIDDAAYDDDDNYTLDFDRDMINYGATYAFNKWQVNFNGGVSFSERSAIDDSSRVDEMGNYDQTYVSNATKGQLSTQELQLSYYATGATALLGAGVYREQMDLNNYIYANSAFGLFEQTSNYDSLDLSLNSKYVFGSVNLNGKQLMPAFNGLSLTVSGRYTSLDNGQDNFSFDISPVYTKGKTTLFASYSEGFNNPSLTQLFDPNGQFNFTTRGNPDLKPETSQSTEIGIKQRINKGAWITASVFKTNVKNAIEYVYLWDGSVPQQDLSFLQYLGDTYINIAKQIVSGVEIEARAQFSPKIKAAVSFNYLEGEYRFDNNELNQAYVGGNHVQLFTTGIFINEDEKSSELIRRPSFQAFGSLTYSPIEAFNLTTTLQVTDARPDVFYDNSLGPFGALNTKEVERYALLGFQAQWNISPKIFSTLFVENVLNETYAEINGFNTRGRSFYLKVGYQF